MNIANDHVISMNYTLTDDKGTTLDTSEGREPLVYLQGKGQIIPGLEKAMLGKSKGEKFSITIQPEEGYGERNEEMIHSVPKTEFPEADKVEVGMQFQVDGEQGPMILTIIEIKDTEFVLDGNHPLAGIILNFAVEICEVREATKEELDHGHVHGPGGHQH